MAIIPWRSFRDLDSFFDDDNWLAFPSRNFRNMELPEMDIYETDKDVVAKINLPGIKPGDIDVSVENQVLTIKGERREEKEEEEKQKGYYRKEIRKGSFQRSVHLPAQVEDGKAKAEIDDGVLEVTIPKMKSSSKGENKIEVKEKNK